MRDPVPTYDWYLNEHRGQAGRDEFLAALPGALARLRAVTRPGAVPARLRAAWMHAVCALADRAAGVDPAGSVRSETVGATSVTYADAVAASTDADAVRPWLAGTGMLYRGLR